MRQKTGCPLDISLLNMYIQGVCTLKLWGLFACVSLQQLYYIKRYVVRMRVYMCNVVEIGKLTIL